MAQKEKNPFDEFDAPSTTADKNPFDDFDVKAAPPPKQPSLRETIGEYAGVGARALSPYAAAASLGAAAGSPFAGVGAVPGAAGGVLSLGLGDLATGGYNLIAPVFGGERVPLPSETIQNAFERIGVGRRPQTAGQQVFSDILQAGGGGLSQAKSAQSLSNFMASPQARNWMRALGENARLQTGVAAGGAAAPSIAANYFDVEDPSALLGLSLGGALVGAKAATPKAKPIPAATLKTKATDLYREMERANVNIAPQAMTDLKRTALDQLSKLKYDPDTDKLVTEALNLFDKKAGKPISFDMLEKFRRSIRDLPYSESGGKRGTNEERAMIKALDDLIDDFASNLQPGQTTSGDAAAAASFLSQARNVRARAYQTETLENAIEAANNRAKQGDNPRALASALRSEFSKIVNNPRRLAKFDASTQKAIKDVANGTITRNTLAAIGKIAPSSRIFGMQIPFLGVGATYSPGTAATLAALQTGGMAARGGANVMSKRAANEALIRASGMKPNAPGWNLLSPAAQQMVLSQERAPAAQKRKNAMAKK